jgi:hypothetical protein
MCFSIYCEILYVKGIKKNIVPISDIYKTFLRAQAQTLNEAYKKVRKTQEKRKKKA